MLESETALAVERGDVGLEEESRQFPFLTDLLAGLKADREAMCIRALIGLSGASIVVARAFL